MNIPKTLRTWIEIDRRAIEKNYRLFRRIIGKKTGFAAVIKSNAYGHNVYLYAKEMERLGADILCVDSLVEGISLRRAGITAPMLVLGYTLPTLFSKAGKHGVALAISSFESLAALKRYRGAPLAIHVKIDTGMHRQGFQWGEEKKVITVLKSLPRTIRVEGLFTHLAEAKQPKRAVKTRRQLALFAKWKKTLRNEHIPAIVHAAASGGMFLYPEAHEDMVRVGISIYGVWPSAEVREYRKDLMLHPVLSWRSIVSEVKMIEKGERVGYDSTEAVLKRSRIVVIPIGYWHGYPRLLSGRSRVLIRGKRAKLLGRVSMDMIVVDATDIRAVKVGDVVTLIGRDGKEEVTADELAALSQTTAYEILTRLNPRMERVLT